ncbi:MAG: ATP-binding protein [Salinibacter sp.]
MLRSLIATLVFLAGPPPVFAQLGTAPGQSGQRGIGQPGTASTSVGRAEWGLPFPSEHYAPQDYGQDAQNWAVTQDDRGLIYVANNDGILEYDGERWRLIPTATGTIVRSLATDSLVYVGAKDDFGRLRPDSNGVLRYQSLYEHVPASARDFKDIWSTHTLDGDAYFQSNKYLFRWDGAEVDVWSSPSGFHTSFVVRGTLYVRDRSRGLLRMEGDSLTLAPDGDVFSDAAVRMMAPYSDGRILIATAKKGLYLLDQEGIRSFRLPSDSGLPSFLDEHDLYHGCALRGDRYALATLGGGTAIISAEGRILRLLNTSTGLPDGVVNYVYAGREGELWMALNNDGVYRTSLNASTTLFDERNGLKGTLRSLEQHRGRMYAATGRGLYRLEGGDSDVGTDPARFNRQSGIPLPWDLLSTKGDLLAATERGVFVPASNPRRLTDRQTYGLAEGPNPQTVYAATRTGVSRLRKTDGQWRSRVVKNLRSEIRSLTVGPDGNLWAGTVDGQMIYLSLSPDGRARSVQSYGTDAGLPAGYKSPVVVDEHLTIRSRQGLFHLKNPDAPPSDWAFAASSLLPEKDGADTLAVKAFLNNDQAHRWAALGNRLYVGRRTQGGRHAWSEIEPLRFPKAEGVLLHAEPDGTLWLGTGKRVVRYTPVQAPRADAPAPFGALVRQVTTLPRGTVVYGGTPRSEQARPSLTLPYSQNSLRIDVAAALMDRVTAPQYQYRLEGRQSTWTGWTGRPHVTFSNLWEGTYTFRVRAKGERGRISSVGRLTLHIRPPWYRSPWAYLLYGVGALGLLFALRHYYRVNQERREAQRQALKLEKEREVRQQLERANERLREANQLKEDFLANTSHELRTPLTNILGFVDVLRDSATDHQGQFLNAIEKNSRRLERTLNALLDLSKLRSGSEDLELEPTALGDRVERVARDFERTAEGKGLLFEVDRPSTEVYADADERYLDQILSNLIENAIKFTEQGRVVVSVRADEEWAGIAVEDSGIGIDEEFLPKLFQDFEQESRGRSRTHEGYGLGLAISSKLANRMDGHLEVESTKGEGSTFTLSLPRSTPRPDAALSDAERTADPRTGD